MRVLQEDICNEVPRLMGANPVNGDTGKSKVWVIDVEGNALARRLSNFALKCYQF
jgi:hypothetical protein